MRSLVKLLYAVWVHRSQGPPEQGAAVANPSFNLNPNPCFLYTYHNTVGGFRLKPGFATTAHRSVCSLQ